MNLPVDCEYDVYVQKLTFPKEPHARKYYQSIRKQKARTNSKGPNIFTDTYLKTRALKFDFVRYEEMILQNRAVVQKLNTIQRNTLRLVKTRIDTSKPYSNASWREPYKRHLACEAAKRLYTENLNFVLSINIIKRSNLAKVGKLTDANGPVFYTEIYFQPSKLKQDYARFSEIIKGNVELLQIINNIQRGTIKKAVTRTDANAPNFSTDTYFRSGHLTVDYNRFKDINKENFDLLQAVNVIERDTGRTENYNPNAGDYADRRSGPYIKQVLKFEKENHQLYKNIMKATGRLPSHKVLLKQWRENQHKIQFKARMPIALPYIADHSRIKAIVKTKRPIVFLDLANSNGTSIGRLRIVLYYDIAPKASMNFIELCVKSKKDAGKNKPSLIGTCFHRIFTDLYAEGGDMIYRNGCGGKSAEGRDFPPENFLVNHNCRGTLSMRPTEAGYVNSIFTISFRPIPSLNGKRIAFGRVIQGLKNLKVLESFASKNGKPKQTIIIKNCGLLYNMPQHNSTSP